ncbi:mitofilin family membrane protein [Allopontixanthobacter sp.]|uniref:mitofilin family membrane protein n=1 Tax=Allopontixanthobacter sp. TaxID=2906452 RepID=UPI002ABBD7AE|nr:mitofilin family membrane protein [Allopontixanthobacter sp.]MDZ4307075.1 mitofilin family membrane protein [Allopontixanthobacter sp.]
MERYPSQVSRKTTPLRTILWATGGAFLLGASLVGYIAYKMDGNWDKVIKTEQDSQIATVAGDAPEVPGPTPSPTETAAQAEAAEEAVERVAEQQGGLNQRLAAAEQRLAQLDLQTQAATGNAARAEGLLIAFATRRTMERGAELGYLADQLRIRFSDALPNAVNTVIETSRNPVTLDQLLARLEGLGPELSDSTEEPSFDRFRRELSELFIIRRESSPSPQPERRLERARYFLESGRVSAAIEEVKKLPGASRASAWIKDAERYAAAQQALDLIETSAVLEPRRLRDGDGNLVQQASPVEAGA